MTRRLYLCDGSARRLALPGEYAGPFEWAVREAVARYDASLRRLACSAWAIEDDRGAFVLLADLFRRKRPRDAPGLFDDEQPRRADRGKEKAPGQGALSKGSNNVR